MSLFMPVSFVSFLLNRVANIIIFNKVLQQLKAMS